MTTPFWKKNWKKYLLVLIALLVGSCLVVAGYTTLHNLNNHPKTITLTSTPSLTPKPTSTPRPILSPTPPINYQLDSEGYYIADFGLGGGYKADQFFLGQGVNLTEESDWIKEHGSYPNLNLILPITFNVTRKQREVTSGDFVTFDGTTNLPPNSLIGIEIFPDWPVGFYGLHQYFSAPVLPGVNGTNLVKVKIPVMDIHLDPYRGAANEFFTNGTYSPFITFGPYLACPWITSDPAHPMIVEKNDCQSAHMGPLYCNTTNEWWWTNSTSDHHVWERYDPLYENGTIIPYPTYPRPIKPKPKT